MTFVRNGTLDHPNTLGSAPVCLKIGSQIGTSLP